VISFPQTIEGDRIRVSATTFIAYETCPAMGRARLEGEIGASSLNYKLGDLGITPSSLRRIIDEVGELYERFKTFPEQGFEGAEVSLEAEPRPGVEVVGKVDAVFDSDGETRLLDWKTGGIGEAETQLRFYAMLWALTHHELPTEVVAVSVRTGERFAETPTVQDASDVAQRVGSMVNEVRTAWIEGDESLRVGGPWCRYCPLLDSCNEGRSVVALL
jgi:hypothetical protein